MTIPIIPLTKVENGVVFLLRTGFFSSNEAKIRFVDLRKVYFLVHISSAVLTLDTHSQLFSIYNMLHRV